MTLYHYTCAHGRAAIIKSGMIVKPNPVTGWAWFTDLTPPDRVGLGLTSYMLECDRTEFRFTVIDDKPVPYVDIRKALPQATRDGWEGAPGALLMHWWISSRPVEVAE
jgi:hypothetical protein